MQRIIAIYFYIDVDQTSKPSFCAPEAHSFLPIGLFISEVFSHDACYSQR